MNLYGSWKEEISIDGESFRADLVDASYAERAGLSKIYAIKGMPAKFEVPIIKASQVCDVPHTWRVKECGTEDEVTEKILALGREALETDIKLRRSHITTYVGIQDGPGDDYIFLAAGAIRDKLTSDYQNEEFPVVSRAIVAPAYRGKGLGSLIVEHRFKAVLKYFSKPPKAIHFGTESEKILHSIKKVEREENLKYVYIGNEEYETFDGVHVVKDYLCFMPWFQELLLKACDTLKEISSSPNIVQEFRDKLLWFMTSGIEKVSGSELKKLFENVAESVNHSSPYKDTLQNIAEIFMVKDKIGAMDPK